MDKLREYLKGKKSYIVAGIGLASALVAWIEGGLSNTELIAAVFAAAQAVCLRAGIDNAVNKTAG